LFTSPIQPIFFPALFFFLGLYASLLLTARTGFIAVTLACCFIALYNFFVNLDIGHIKYPRQVSKGTLVRCVVYFSLAIVSIYILYHSALFKTVQLLWRFDPSGRDVLIEKVINLGVRGNHSFSPLLGFSFNTDLFLQYADQYPHNAFLHVFISSGIIGILLMIACFCGLLINTYQPCKLFYFCELSFILAAQFTPSPFALIPLAIVLGLRRDINQSVGHRPTS